MDKNEILIVRISKIDKRILQKKAEEKNKTLSKYVRDKLIGLDEKPLTEKEKIYYADFSRFHTAFARIGNLYKQNIDIIQDIRSIMFELKEELKIFRRSK